MTRRTLAFLRCTEPGDHGSNPRQSECASAERFKYEYQVLSQFNTEWAKRNVGETAAMFRKYGLPRDVALPPEIGEAL
jgi:hypothetical protein